MPKLHTLDARHIKFFQEQSLLNGKPPSHRDLTIKCLATTDTNALPLSKLTNRASSMCPRFRHPHGLAISNDAIVLTLRPTSR
jgi:hypothetical protein